MDPSCQPHVWPAAVGVLAQPQLVGHDDSKWEVLASAPNHQCLAVGRPAEAVVEQHGCASDLRTPKRRPMMGLSVLRGAMAMMDLPTAAQPMAFATREALSCR